MNYANIKYNDISNGEGIRTSLFVSGCNFNCPGCFNKEAQDFNYGEFFTDEIMNNILDSIDDEFHSGITILGGEPLDEQNASKLIRLCSKFRERFGYTKSIWVYTGYTFETIRSDNLLHNNANQILSYIDVLVDGRFIESQKDITLVFKGSRNQRIIDVKKSIKEGEVINYGKY